MLAIASPQWSEEYGRYVIYGFTPKLSYDHQAIVTIDGRVACAHVGSCTWQWLYFNDIPDHIAEAVGRVRVLRDAMERMPEYAHYVQPLLDERLKSLSAQVNNCIEEADPSATTDLGLQD